jgi:hypothetical protein
MKSEWMWEGEREREKQESDAVYKCEGEYARQDQCISQDECEPETVQTA